MIINIFFIVWYGQCKNFISPNGCSCQSRKFWFLNKKCIIKYLHSFFLGGPLIDLEGRVIGMNSMKAAGVDGISFAIPIETIKIITNELLDKKKVVRPYIGIKVFILKI